MGFDIVSYLLGKQAGGGSTNLQSKTVSPTTSQQTVSPDSGYDGLSSVTVSAISPTKGAQTYTPGTANQTIAAGRWLTGAQTIAGDANLVASNIKNGVSIFGVVGSYSGGGGSNPYLETADDFFDSSSFSGVVAITEDKNGQHADLWGNKYTTEDHGYWDQVSTYTIQYVPSSGLSFVGLLLMPTVQW